MSHTYRLVVLTGIQQGTVYELTEGQTFVLGRGNDSHTKIQDPILSRIHCRIDWLDDKPWLVDAGSTSGTMVGGKRINRHPLESGDVITLGNSTIRFEVEGRTRDEMLAENPWLKNNALFQAPAPKIKPVASLLGKSLSHFRLDAILAEGESGVVFRATDTQKNQTVAVKVLTPDAEDQEEQKERFVRAMKTTIDLRHPHIVPLLGAGKNGPYCWAAMELIEGISLAKLIQEIGIGNSLPWQEAFLVGVQIGRALEEAEKRKIIHRNVTPRNILRRTVDSCHLLSDLMLAKALEGTQARDVTKPGQIVGELPYLPPERTKSGSTIDERSDLYGLGATMYALIAGRPPAVGRGMMELIKSIRDEVPPKPSVFQKDIDPELEEIILRLIAKDPSERFQSAFLLLNSLNRVAERCRLDIDRTTWI